MKLRHKLTGIEGLFVHRWHVTGKTDYSMVVINGKKYYAPSEEFEEV